MTANVFQVTDPLTAAAEPNRRRILQLLGAHQRTVSDLAAEFTVTRSAISQHLLVLADAGLVEAEKVGRQRIYRVLPSGLQRLQAEINRFWTDELDSLVDDAEQLQEKQMSYTQSKLLPVSPDEAFALVTEPERMRRWLAVTAYVDLRAGGDFRWTVATGNHAAGTVREVEPGRRLVLGWGWEENEELPPDTSSVTIVIEPAEGGSRVTLTHEGLNDEQTKQHAEGWDHYLERLQQCATTGDAGPDEWARVPQHLDPVTAAEAVLAAVQPVLRVLGPTDRPRPTPCAEFTAEELFDHLMGTLVQLGGLAGATVVAAKEGTVENCISLTAGQAIDAWRAVDLDGTVPGPGGNEVPASYLAGILPLELALHGWDFAQARGLDLSIADEVVAYLRTIAEGLVPDGRENGNFKPEVEAPEGASALDRLAAYAGRSPLVA